MGGAGGQSGRDFGDGQEPVVGVFELRVAQEDQMGEFLGQGPRGAYQPHARFRQEPVPLAPVAAPAGDDLVLPASGRAAPRGRHHVVDREVRGRHAFPAVLTGILVPQEEVAPVRPQQAARDLDVGQQPHDDDFVAKLAPFDRLFYGMTGGSIDEADALLGEQNNQPPLTDDVQRLQ